mgnify:CR=1 FL=1
MKNKITIASKSLLLLIFIFGVFTNFSLAAKSDVYLADETLKEARQQQIEVSGTVTDAQTGDPLPGVNIVIQGTTQGTTTDMDGEYSIEVPSDARLVFSFVGYQEQTVRVRGREEINIALKQAVTELEEVVAIGYGTQRRRDITGSISSARSEDLELESVNSPDEAMQGKLSGVNVFAGSHKPGGGISVKVRGSASISAGGSPLYVIDGMPISETQGGGLGGGRSGNNPLMTLDPSNIESMQVLKGASATAIYGSRGASGVVLITTKEGQAGEGQIDYQGSMSFARPTKQLDLLNAKEHARLLNEMTAIKGQEPMFSDSEISAMDEGTDWQEAIFRDPATSQKHNLTFSGGSDDIQYLVGAGVTDKQGIVVNSGLTRYSGQINLNAQITDRLSVDENLQITHTSQNEAITGSKGYGSQGNLIVNILDASPTMPIYNESGDYMMPYNHRTGGMTFDNPVFKAREYVLDHNITDIKGNVQLTYNLLEGLDFQTSFGLQNKSGEDGTYYPINSVRARPYAGSASIGRDKTMKITNDNLLKYNNTFGEVHDLDVTAGYTYEQEDVNWSGGSAQDFPSDYFTYKNLGAAGIIGDPWNGSYSWRLMSYLGRVNYTFDDTYSLSVSARADGSSKFGANSKWGFFPAAALGWTISNESFMEDMDFISNLKLRLSYGQSGNDRIGTYSSLATVDFYTDYAFGGNTLNNQVTCAGPSGIPNPDLGWEQSTDYDIGLDVSFFENRITMVMDYYYQKTTNMILGVPLPHQSGFGGVDQNTGAMENEGFELNLTSYNISGDNFTWKTSLNFSTNRNEILDLGAKDFIYVGWAGSGNVWFHGRHVARLEAGHPVGAFYGSVMHPNSVWKDQEQIDEVGTMPDASPGDYRFVDTNGDGSYSGDDDTYVGNPNPDFIYGLTNTMSVGNFNIRLFLQGTYGNDILMLTKNELAGGTNLWREDRENRWTQDNPRTGPDVTGSANSGPRYGQDVIGPVGRQGYPNLVNTDNVYDGSFLRVKNLRIAYTLPQSLTGFRKTQIYVSGTNLLTFTDYPGYDPEVNAATGSNTVKGVDRFPYPAERLFRIGVNLGL